MVDSELTRPHLSENLRWSGIYIKVNKKCDNDEEYEYKKHWLDMYA